MISDSEFVSAAEHLGFVKTYFLPVDDIPTNYSKLVSSPEEVLPGAKTLILMIMPYELAENNGSREGVISTYYRASQKAYKGTKELTSILINSGAHAIYNANIPLKSAIVKYNIGIQRLNSLTYIDGIGSAFHIQNIITDNEFELSILSAGFSPVDCSKCERCVKACPSKAISDTGYIDPDRCLRSVSEQKEIPKEVESLLGNRLLGCDVCQMVCPHNKVYGSERSFTYPLKKLLMGELGDLPDIIGPNLARNTRMICKACVLAANNERTDLLPLLEELAGSKDEFVLAAASRAIDRLEEKQ
ncbi:MAG: epoxyqueuosine reductase [Clostridia bacterium]|nr:epoxyqueuosine reductase [Clostridia bacterium]